MWWYLLSLIVVVCVATLAIMLRGVWIQRGLCRGTALRDSDGRLLGLTGLTIERPRPPKMLDGRVFPRSFWRRWMGRRSR